MVSCTDVLCPDPVQMVVHMLTCITCTIIISIEIQLFLIKELLFEAIKILPKLELYWRKGTCK